MAHRHPTATLASVLFICTISAYAACAPPLADSENEFLTGMHAAMQRMDQAMTARASGNVDADFVTMMVPHHQAAIDMAQLQLRYGHNTQLNRLAQEIIVEQQQEITVMRRALRGAP